jgi:hypothetical protein
MLSKQLGPQGIFKEQKCKTNIRLSLTYYNLRVCINCPMKAGNMKDLGGGGHMCVYAGVCVCKSQCKANICRSGILMLWIGWNFQNYYDKRRLVITCFVNVVIKWYNDIAYIMVQFWNSVCKSCCRNNDSLELWSSSLCKVFHSLVTSYLVFPISSTLHSQKPLLFQSSLRWQQFEIHIMHWIKLIIISRWYTLQYKRLSGLLIQMFPYLEQWVLKLYNNVYSPKT